MNGIYGRRYAKERVVHEIEREREDWQKRRGLKEGVTGKFEERIWGEDRETKYKIQNVCR